jgi:hypothetical protein
MMGEKKRTGGGGRVTQLTMEAACQHFLLAKRRENCSERTIVLYGNWLSRWRRFLQELGFSGLLGDLTLAEGQSFADHLHGIEKRFKEHPFAGFRSGRRNPATSLRTKRSTRWRRWKRWQGTTCGVSVRTESV